MQIFNNKIVLFLLIIVSTGFFVVRLAHPQTQPQKINWWQVQSIDTMKYSRDIAGEKLKDTSFDRVIEDQVDKIARTGATHIAIATPYDEEFLHFLRRWVNAARKKNLLVWFRGNFSGCEGWFGYAKINPDEHLTKTKNFIENHADLFSDGDIFTSCPECENGGPGDPRQTRDVDGHRRFLIDEYNVAKSAFSKINKKVLPGF